MDRKDIRYTNYIQILKEELRPAMGCTEPIAIAYAAAKAAAVLGETPDRILAEVSGNIIKNVKSVVVPHTGGLRGIQAAAAAGAVAGDADAELEVISNVTPQQIEEIASIPGREELIARFLGSIQAPVGAFARVIKAIADAKEGGDAPAEAPAEA